MSEGKGQAMAGQIGIGGVENAIGDGVVGRRVHCIGTGGVERGLQRRLEGN